VRNAWLISGLGASLVVVCQAVAAPAPVDLPAFMSTLDQLEHDVRTASPQTAGDIAKSMPDRWIVRAGTDRFDVSSQAWVSSLRGASRRAAVWPRQRAALADRIAAVRREAAAWGGTPHSPPPARARELLTSVLSAREFQQNPVAEYYGQLKGLVSRWIAGLLRRLGIASPASVAASTAMTWLVGILALASLAWWLVRVLRRSRRPLEFVRLTGSQPGRHSSMEWAARAWAAAAAGHAVEAMRCAHHAAVERLAEQGVWRVDDARTPREYLGALSARDSRRPALADITHRVERACYAGVDPGADDAREALARLKDLGCEPPANLAI
jgi:hypothetical protein